MELGPLFEYLWSIKNLIIMGGCGAVMEIFKRGPLTKVFAETKWGKISAYYAPYPWCIAFLLIPWGLAPATAGLGEKIVLGLLLGAATSTFYGIFAGTLKHMRARKAEELLRK